MSGAPEPKEDWGAEDWKDLRREQQDRRAARLPGRQAEIEALSGSGYRVVKLTEYQFRINGKVDLYPIHRRYHVLATGRRGTYRNLSAFITGVFLDLTKGVPR